MIPGDIAMRHTFSKLASRNRPHTAPQHGDMPPAHATVTGHTAAANEMTQQNKASSVHSWQCAPTSGVSRQRLLQSPCALTAAQIGPACCHAHHASRLQQHTQRSSE
jgi:hypothetical protein